jgi:hypothetical protein
MVEMLLYTFKITEPALSLAVRVRPRFSVGVASDVEADSSSIPHSSGMHSYTIHKMSRRVLRSGSASTWPWSVELSAAALGIDRASAWGE